MAAAPMTQPLAAPAAMVAKRTAVTGCARRPQVTKQCFRGTLVNRARFVGDASICREPGVHRHLPHQRCIERVDSHDSQTERTVEQLPLHAPILLENITGEIEAEALVRRFGFVEAEPRWTLLTAGLGVARRIKDPGGCERVVVLQPR